MRASSTKHTGREPGLAQLWALFALIVYTPLPLASNRPWALALLGLLTGCLFLWNLWWPSGRSAELAWKCARTPLILLSLWTMLLVIQLVPLPDVWIHSLGQRVFYDSGASMGSGATISVDTYSTRLYLAKASILLGVFWLVLTLVNSRRRIEWLAVVVVCSGLVQAMVGVVIMATGAKFQLFFVPIHEVRAHGTFVSPNHFAGYLELALAMGIGLMIAKLNARPVASWRQRLHDLLALLLSGKAMLRLALIIMVVGLVASRSRMGNTAFFASLLITGMFTVIFTKRSSCKNQHASNIMYSTIAFVASLIVLDVVIIGGMVGVEKIVQRIENTNLEMQVKSAKANGVLIDALPSKLDNDGVDVGQSMQPVASSEESLELRARAGRSAIQIVRDFPWLGTGGGTFYLAFQHYRPIENYGYYDHAHNDFVELASETGLLGLLLLVIMVVDSVWRSCVLLVRSNDQLARGMAFASLMGITSLLIHSTVDFNLQIPANAMLFLILVSLPYSVKTMSKR